MFNDKTRFWVIFDTSTRREYYLDVHNLLALPVGATLRYEYREKYLSTAARFAAENADSAPAFVLLVYGQWKQYVKGDIPHGGLPAGGTAKQSPPFSEMLWVPTRFAEMQLIPSPEAANYFFDFKLLGYPNVDQTALSQILTPLDAAAEVPFHKWVSLSNDLKAFESLQRGKDSENWQAIVDKLGTPPSQFAGDSFFRLTGSYRGLMGRPITPTYIEDKQTTGVSVEVRQVEAVYDVYENETFSVEVISASPPPSKARDDKPERYLNIQSADNSPLQVEGNKSVGLRQYTREGLKIRAKRYDELDEKAAILTFSAGKDADAWPSGASFDQNFRISKRPVKVWAALVTGTMAAVLLLFVVKLWDKNPTVSVIFASIAILLAVMTGLLLTGRIGFKL